MATIETVVSPIVVRVYQDHEEKEGWWTTFVVGVPGVASEGSTLPAALEALADALSVYLKDGGVIPCGTEYSSDIPVVTVEHP